jgi:hypothetical protein
MVAIITDKLKKAFVQKLYDDVGDSAQRYYISIGRSQAWNDSDNVPTPTNTIKTERETRYAFQSIKSAADVTFVVPRNNWSTGTIYSAFNDDQAGYPTYKHYIITNDNAVYICLQQGINATGSTVTSTVEPTGSASTSFKTSDGYVWKFLYTVSTANANKFLSANYMPVQLQGTTDSSSTATEVEQETIQNATIAGQLGGYSVIRGGTGYTSAPTVTVVGDGDSASGIAYVNGGAIVKVDLDSSLGTLLHGNGYNYAEVTLSGGGGSGAKVDPIFSPTLGFGADPRDDLKSTAIMFNTKPNGIEGGKFFVDNDFRQIALIKNPLVPTTDSDYSASTGIAAKKLKFDAVATAFTPDNTMLGGTSGAAAYVVSVDSSVVYYYQTDSSGFVQFSEGEAVTETDGSGSGTLDSAGVDADTLAYMFNDINPWKGDVLYIENRAPVERDAAQTEDLKIVIQL